MTTAATAPDPGSFDRFFADMAREVAAVVALTTGDVGLAEDATQEAMARAHRRWGEVGALDRPDRWVIRVATRVAIDDWRKRRRERPLGDGPALVHDDVHRLWVRWGLEGLAPMDRALLILRHRDGFTEEEVAAFMGRSRHTIASYLKRARRRLRARLSEAE